MLYVLAYLFWYLGSVYCVFVIVVINNTYFVVLVGHQYIHLVVFQD